MNKQPFVTLLAIAALGSITIAQRYPNVADTSHATPSAAKFFDGYFTAKSLHNANSWFQFFNHQAVYYDATLGQGFPNRSSLEASLTPLVQSWPKTAKSYPLRILGDTTNAVVHYVDTPGLFGAEIRVLAAFDFKNGTVARQVDYWDGRRNPIIAGRPETLHPYDLGAKTVVETAPDKVARQLNAAFTSGNVSAAVALISYDAVFEDITLRARLEGQLAISRYLHRALPRLPYGEGAVVRHVLGNAQGGGYEWQTGGPVLNGITAWERDRNGLVTRLTVVWDGSRMSDQEIQALAGLSIEN